MFKLIYKKYLSTKYYFKNQNRGRVLALSITLIACSILIWNNNWIMYKELRKDYNHAIVIYNTAKNAREMRETNANSHEIEKNDQTDDEQEEVSQNATQGEEMRISFYSDADSCHYPVGDGTCYNAIGKIARIGTAACPLDMLYETINVEGIGELICEDKYSKWVEEKHGRTIDVFLGYGKTEEATNTGVKQRLVTIL